MPAACKKFLQLQLGSTAESNSQISGKNLKERSNSAEKRNEWNF